MMDLATTECDDGTICENFTPCVRQTIEEGSYGCDCTATQHSQWRKREVHSSDDGQHDEAPKYAGLSCEHIVTSYCERGSETSTHAFCANGGECEAMVGRDETHAGCRCPAGYEGDHCQFVEGSIGNSTHLRLPRAGNGVRPGEGLPGEEPIIVAFGIEAGIIIAFGIVVGVFFSWSVAEPRREVAAGGLTIPRKQRKAPTGQFVSVDTLEADGEVLTKALEDRENATGERPAGIDEPNLDDTPNQFTGIV